MNGQNVIYNRQTALAGSDIELTTSKGWNGPEGTRKFVDGYNSVTNRMLFINYGSNEVGTCTNASACANPMKHGGWDGAARLLRVARRGQSLLPELALTGFTSTTVSFRAADGWTGAYNPSTGGITMQEPKGPCPPWCPPAP